MSGETIFCKSLWQNNSLLGNCEPLKIRLLLYSIGGRKDAVCLFLYGQKSSSRRTAIYAMLDPFVLIQVLYSSWVKNSWNFHARWRSELVFPDRKPKPKQMFSLKISVGIISLYILSLSYFHSDSLLPNLFPFVYVSYLKDQETLA